MRGMLTGVGIGVAAGLGARAALPAVLRRKFTADVARLNAGDPTALLGAYADDAVLHFPQGDHRFSGAWTGKPAIERFLRIFVASRIQGELRDVAVSGPPWAMTIWVRFDDHADADDGTRLYENRTVLVLRTRWGRVVDHEDFFTDTERIVAFDRALSEREPELAVVGSARR
jgi:ketosteroid isomerase-like protein